MLADSGYPPANPPGWIELTTDGGRVSQGGEKVNAGDDSGSTMNGYAEDSINFWGTLKVRSHSQARKGPPAPASARALHPKLL